LVGGPNPQALVLPISISDVEHDPIEIFLRATVSDVKIVASEKYSVSPAYIVLM
jgi:hypothetical protein